MLPTDSLRRRLAVLAGVFGGIMLLAGTAPAAGPRWTTGWPYYQNNNGNPVAWYTTQPQYFTDPGDLSAYVNHAAADAMVASAAGTWNVSTSSLTLAQGGALNEHVSSANVYLGPSGPVFPSDVQASNYAAKQIAVIYDSDGSVTDTLLGGGASDPGNCRQSAVTESVDSISTSGQILHALIVLNGRCTGSAAALQMEMKYRLVRAFGRILGLGWSQVNDNVFTGVPQPTSQQAMNWPIMHPIDVLCGPYAYQCMVQPFTLRPDDVGSLTSIYPVSTDGNGKTGSFDNAASFIGLVSFPNGQGMQGVLVSVRRFHFGPGYTDAFDVTSGVTGAYFQQIAGSPIVPKGSSLADSNGTWDQFYEGYYSLGWIPIPTADYFDNMYLSTSAVNPLYTGQYAVGPYPASQVTPSGSPMTATATVIARGYQNVAVSMTSTDAPATCPSGGDGSVYTPLAVTPSGSWSDTLCGYQHSAWSALQVQASRTLTVEVTATDEQGYATTGKMLPVIGVWDSNDSVNALPTLASQTAPLNASTLGMTNLLVSSSTARTMRIGIADLRGDGRPDYGYNARILYADSISPASLPANGGVVTISGMGFHPGNTVTVNGIAANVTNWTATSITLVAPPITGPLAADVVVSDLSTGGQTTMSQALTYSQTALPDSLTVVTKPADGGYVGSVGSPVFKVQVMLPDGVTPAASTGVTFSSTAAMFGACSGASTCMVTTDSSGFVSSSVTPTSAGIVTLVATVGSSSVSATFNALAVPVDGLTVTSLPSGTVYATLPATVPFSVKVTLPGSTTAAAGASVLVTATNAALGACSGASTCTLIADASGTISSAITPAAAGVVSLLATAGGGTVSASFGATALPADILRVVSKPADGSYVGRTASGPFAVQVMLGDNATPASGIAVTLSATGATLTACGASTCVLTADATGSVSTSVVPTAAGTVTLNASAGGGTVATSFNSVVVPPDVLHAVSKPADGSYVGRVASIPFNVQVALGDTGAAAAGVSVNVSATNGILNACGAATCTLIADSTGSISTTVTPSAVGTVGLTASAGGGTLTVSFLAASIPPDTLTILIKPADGSYAGRTAALPFAVQIFSGETGAPASTVAVILTATNATLSACAGAFSCTITADGTGTISTTVSPTVVGTVSLSASAGGGTASTTFSAVAIPPDALHVATQPASGSYVDRTAAIPFAVQVTLGDTGGPAAGVSVSVSATNALLNACGASTCTLTADSTGTISTTVTPSAVGAVGLTAAAGGGTVSTTFNAISIPPDALTIMTQPASGSYVGRTAAIPFAVHVALGDTGGPASGVSVTVSATNALLNACGAATCTLTADASGNVSTTITPSSAGTVGLTASAGGGAASTTFNAVVVPPDAVHVVTQPTNGSYVGRIAAMSFTVQVALGDTGAAASGVSVNLSATNALLNACGGTTCTLTADSTGTVSTTVTPSVVGSVGLAAVAGGGTASISFNAIAVPPDALHVVAQPADGSYIGGSATIPFTVQVALGDTGAPAANTSVVVTATNAMLDACGAATCTLPTDSTGTISTTVTPTAAGTVTLTASAGGGSVSTSFVAAPIPPDTLNILTSPVDGAYIGRVAALPFSVQVLDGKSGAPSSGASVTVSATGATFSACGNTSSCVLTADATGTISTTLTPTSVGIVSLSVSENGSVAGVFFHAIAVPPDTLTIVTQPANGSYAGRPAAIPFSVQVALGDTGAQASGATVTMSATNALLNACGLATCSLTADSTGTISTTVTPSAAGAVALSASAGGGAVSTTFNAVVVPPDVLHVVTQPATGSYVGRTAAIPFSVQVALGDTGGPAANVSVTVTATNATLDACGAPACTLTTDATGTISTSVTPTAVGVVSLSASAGGGTVSTTFNAVAVPPDSLHLISKPADGAYVGRAATLPFAVQIALGDTGAPASGASVTVSVTNATLSGCPSATCILTADSTGSISTTVTPTAVGVVSLSASAGGGALSTTFNAVAVPPDTLHVVAQPTAGSYVGRAAAIPLSVQVALGDTGGPAAGASVTVSATNAVFTACSASTCTLTADANGTITTTVTPSAVGSVGLTASAGGGFVSTSFNAVAIPPDTLNVVTKPADGSYIGRVATLPFAVQVLLGDTGGAATTTSVTVSATNATLGCGSSACTLTTDATGAISTTVTPSTAGIVGLSASAGGGTVSTSFNAVVVPPDSLHVLTQPTNGAYIGVPATIFFSVQVMLGDTGGPANGASVALTATNATLGCGAVTCTLPASATGTVSASVTPTSVGLVSLSASAGGGSVSTSFTAAAMPPDSLLVVTAPADNTYVGSPAGIPFSVSVLLGDGVTPASGASVTVTATGATLGACGLSTCTVTANALGTISISVTAITAGAVTLTASAGGGTVSTTFVAISSPDTLQILSTPSDHSLTNQVAATPFVVRATLGITTNAHLHVLTAIPGSPDVGQTITLTAVGGKLNACGLPVCVLTTDSGGTVSSTVTPLLPGPVALLAAGAGGTISTSFAADTPPDAIHATSVPPNGSYTNRVASAPFAVQVLLGDGVTPAAGVPVTMSATNATLSLCGLATCIVTTDASGSVSTTVTPSTPGSVQLTATAGGGMTTASFTSAAVPPDTLHVTAQPANGSYVGRTATLPFTVQALLGDTNGPATRASVTVTAVNATLGSCGLPTCVLAADATGTISTSVTPTAIGTVQLTASAGGGTASASFDAVAIPPDTLQVTSHPANGSYVARVATSPYTVQVLLGDTGAPAIGVSIALTATDATFGACGATTCTLTTDSTGTVSTNVTPTAVGSVTLTAAAGGGAASSTFTAAAVPPDSLQITSQPANGSYAGRVAAAPFTVQVSLGDTGGPAVGASVLLSATNATFSACAASTCTLTADATGTVSTTLTPTATGLVTLTATAGGGTVSTTFTSSAIPPDVLHVLSQPANGAYAPRVASAPYTVQVLLGDAGNAAAGVSVTLTATGASLGACGLSTCILTADSTGTVSTTVTPTNIGTVQLTATAGGGTVSTTFTSAAIPPDSLQVVSHPADGSYAGSAATIPFAVQTHLGDTGAPAAGASVTVTAPNATFGACNASTCILTADSAGSISTTVTPLAAGVVSLTATAGGGTISSSFNAASAPIDTLRIVSQPTAPVYATVPSSTPFIVQVMLPNGTTPASSAAVTLSASHAVFGSCGGASSCLLTADASGTISTTVTPQQAGVVTLQATAGGGTISTTFTASTLPANILSIVSAPSSPVYVGTVAATRFAVHILLGDGVTPASAASVTLTASGANFGSCIGTCILTTDAYGNISTTVTPTSSGTVTLTASSGGGTVSSTFAVTPDLLRIVSSPANNSYTGSPAAAPLTMQLLLGDGVTPVSSSPVTVASSGATLGACALTTCTLTTDAQGMISTPVTATAAGTVTLTASAASVTVSTSYTAVAPPDTLQVLSSPANGSYVGRASAVPFTVQVSLGTATNRLTSASVTPNVALPTLSGVAVTLSASGATLDACGLASCILTTGILGTVSTTVTPTTAGPVTLSATAAGGTISSSFTAATPPDVLHVASAPTNGSYVGRVASTPFTIQVLQGDGTTPASGVTVTLTASGATLGACGQSTCTLLSDLTGMVSATVTPSAAGNVNLTATAGGGTSSASFTAATPPDVVQITSTPANGSYTGSTASQPFTVKVLLGDGATPAAGASVVLTTSNAVFGACDLPTCTSVADATGTVSTTVIPAITGPITLTASASGGTASSSFTAIDPVRTIAISRSTEYVAAGSTVSWTPVVTLLENGHPVSGIPVTWNSQSGLTLSSSNSITNTSGAASVDIAIGPLASGATPTGTACAWTTICTNFGVPSVDPSAWRLVTVNGDVQTASPADMLQPLTIRAIDDAGDWIAGVTIQVDQLVRGWVSCPPIGRCPIGPVLSSGASTFVSDVDGLATIAPLQVQNTPETTGIVAAAGPNGYISVNLSKVP